MTCAIDECDRHVCARGWCKKHYQRWLTRGTVELSPRFPVEPLRLLVEQRGPVTLSFPLNSAERRAYYRGLRRGWMPDRTAEALAVALRLHPADVWGDLYWAAA